jgi:hypothetical protein
MYVVPPNHSLHRTRPLGRATQTLLGRAGELEIRQLAEV